jgi:hypothetical protein
VIDTIEDSDRTYIPQYFVDQEHRTHMKLDSGCIGRTACVDERPS